MKERSSGGFRNNYGVATGQVAHSSRGPEHVVGHQEKCRPKTEGTWTGRSSDGFRNNFSGRRIDGNTGRDRSKDPGTRGKKGTPVRKQREWGEPAVATKYERKQEGREPPAVA